jgi:hypothetical protein
MQAAADGITSIVATLYVSLLTAGNDILGRADVLGVTGGAILTGYFPAASPARPWEALFFVSHYFCKIK